MNGSNDNAICILDSGDLLLLVTYSNDRIVFVVSSHAMSLASPIWKKTLKPPFPKLVSRIDGDDDLQDKQVDFSEDNGEALLLLLRIAHLQFSKVPSTLTFESLLDVAILYDKYDCVGLVGPWLSLWLSNEETQSKEQGYEEWLFIAWVFGREKTFKELATKLTHEVKINAKGDCLTSTGEIFPSQMPPDIIGGPDIICVYNDEWSCLLMCSVSLLRKHTRHPSGYRQSPTQRALWLCWSLREQQGDHLSREFKGVRRIGLWIPSQRPSRSRPMASEVFQDRTHQCSGTRLQAQLSKYLHLPPRPSPPLLQLPLQLQLGWEERPSCQHAFFYPWPGLGITQPTYANPE